jgi:enamine deaminase RidA (YjgF/YER057c/UK114 family)
LAEVFGDRGTHARAAYGVASLPFGAPVSIDCVCHIAV